MTDIPTDIHAIAEIFWQFHNDRLKDPSINEMKPYIQPILDMMAKNTRKALIKELIEVDLFTPNDPDKKAYINKRISEL